ncbi:hypothetical protein SAMN03159341_101124 [Paenibacillus sp. 1_12]|nr:hypothetical protein SAMN03159341_101124 [Paenibacillus sp. 1_12]
MKPMQQEQPQFLQPENQYAPPMMPIESMNTYPWHDNNQGFEHGTQAQMWGHSHHDMNLFQQYQEPAAEVFTHDYMNAPQHSMWSEPMLSPFAESPYGASMPAEASFGGMPNYPFYQQPQQSIGDCGCGCGGPVMHTQAMPYPYAMPISQMPNAQMPNAQMPNAQMPNAQMPNAPMPYGTWPTAQSPVSYGEMPVYTQGYEPMAANSAYPGSVYPMSMHPAHMVQPYGWSPYGAGMHDCGCNSRYELEQLLRQQSEAEAKAKAEISTNADASEEKKLTVQNTTNSRKKASISTKAAKPAQRNRRSTQKTSKASTNSPWLVR